MRVVADIVVYIVFGSIGFGYAGFGFELDGAHMNWIRFS